ncbi:MAG: galactokinase [Candidatus Dormibacteria bacterium]
MAAADAAGESHPSVQALEERAHAGLVRAFGAGGDVIVAAAPGRCTLVGEHVDYAGGAVLCAAIDLQVAVAMRPAEGVADRVAIDARITERVPGRLRPEGAGYVLAAAVALRESGAYVPAFEAATAASLPAGAGLASSASVICATLVAQLRLASSRLGMAKLVDIAYRAEHDVLGVPSGRLDQHAVVESPEDCALLLDCDADDVTPVPWHLRDTVLCVCDTGERHRVAGDGYRRRRAETEAAMREAGIRSARRFTGELPSGTDVSSRRLRHVVSETRRALDAAAALSAGDDVELGRLMSESHRSLRDDHEVSTPLLDAVETAAEAVPGCYGARLVGAGFGGSVVALVHRRAAPACCGSMRAAAGASSATWVLSPAPGLAFTAGDVVTRD